MAIPKYDELMKPMLATYLVTGTINVVIFPADMYQSLLLNGIRSQQKMPTLRMDTET